jgi:hypothetical protein
MVRLGFAFVSLVLFNVLLVGVAAMGVAWYHWLAPKLERRRARGRAIETVIDKAHRIVLRSQEPQDVSP